MGRAMKGLGSMALRPASFLVLMLVSFPSTIPVSVRFGSLQAAMVGWPFTDGASQSARPD